jgi:hypothetical protein
MAASNSYFTDLPNFSPNASAVLSAAKDEAARRNHNFVGTEHFLFALLSSVSTAEQSGTAPPRVIGWLERKLNGTSVCEHNDWRQKMLRKLESRRTFAFVSLSAPSVPASSLSFTASMRDIFDLVGRLASGPVKDGATVLSQGLVATEFVVAAIMVHGCNIASEVLSYGTSGVITSWMILEAINVDPASVHVRRAALRVQSFSKASPGQETNGDVTPLVCAAGPFIIGTRLPSIDDLPQNGPTE